MTAVRTLREAFVLALATTLAASALLVDGPRGAPPPDCTAAGDRLLALPFVEIADADGPRFVAATFAGSVTVRADGDLVYALPDGTVVRESPVARSAAAVRPGTPSETTVSAFRGRDPAEWRGGLRGFDSVHVDDLAAGIELEVRAGSRNVEKRFHVAPGADVAEIRMRVAGAERLDVLPDGRLAVRTARGPLTFTAPVAFQGTGSGRSEVATRYVVEGDTYGFEVRGRDPSLSLVIDPLIAATYLGGATTGENLLNDEANGVAAHGGSVFVAGSTQADVFPAEYTGPHGFDDTHAGGWTDAFVCRLSGDLGAVEAVTFLGGDGADIAHALTVTDDGVFVTGMTTSTDFPTTVDVVQPDQNDGGEVFVSRLSHDLASLTASTYLGGAGTDEARDIVVDPKLGVVVTGRARSPDLGGHVPATAHQTANAGVFDAFVVRLAPNLGTVLGATFLGGAHSDESNAVAIDGADVLICGSTSSTDFPVDAGAFDTTFVLEEEGFVARLDGGLRNLLACTYLGGELAEYPTDECLDIAVHDGDVIVCGETESEDFPSTPGTFDPTPNKNGYMSSDGFVVRLSSGLTELLAGTFVGGTSSDHVEALAVHADGIVVVGRCGSTDFPVGPDSEDDELDGTSDAFVLVLEHDLSAILEGRLIGGELNEKAADVALDGGAALITGYTLSRSFPTTEGAFDRTFNDELNRTDGYVVSFDAFGKGPPPPIDIDSYILPKRLDVKHHPRRPDKSRVNAGGWFDSGSGEVDWSRAATLTIGARDFDVPGLTPTKKGWWEYRDGPLFFRIKPSRYGSSKGKFKLKLQGTEVTEIPVDEPLLVRFRNGDVDAIGEVELKEGRYKLGRQRGTLIQPRLALYSCKTTLKGDGKDKLRARLGVCTEGGLPDACPPLTIGLDEQFADTLDTDAFDQRKRKFVFKGPKGGLTKATVDFGKEKLAIHGKRIDAGDYPEGAQAVTVLVQLGDDALLLHVRMVRSGKIMRY